MNIFSVALPTAGGLMPLDTRVIPIYGEASTVAGQDRSLSLVSGLQEVNRRQRLAVFAGELHYGHRFERCARCEELFHIALMAEHVTH
jgi:hypothetical protein